MSNTLCLDYVLMRQQDGGQWWEAASTQGRIPISEIRSPLVIGKSRDCFFDVGRMALTEAEEKNGVFYTERKVVEADDTMVGNPHGAILVNPLGEVVYRHLTEQPTAIGRCIPNGGVLRLKLLEMAGTEGGIIRTPNAAISLIRMTDLKELPTPDERVDAEWNITLLVKESSHVELLFGSPPEGSIIPYRYKIDLGLGEFQPTERFINPAGRYN